MTKYYEEINQQFRDIVNMELDDLKIDSIFREEDKFTQVRFYIRNIVNSISCLRSTGLTVDEIESYIELIDIESDDSDLFDDKFALAYAANKNISNIKELQGTIETLTDEIHTIKHILYKENIDDVSSIHEDIIKEVKANII